MPYTVRSSMQWEFREGKKVLEASDIMIEK